MMAITVRFLSHQKDEVMHEPAATQLPGCLILLSVV